MANHLPTIGGDAGGGAGGGADYLSDSNDHWPESDDYMPEVNFGNAVSRNVTSRNVTFEDLLDAPIPETLNESGVASSRVPMPIRGAQPVLLRAENGVLTDDHHGCGADGVIADGVIANGVIADEQTSGKACEAPELCISSTVIPRGLLRGLQSCFALLFSSDDAREKVKLAEISRSLNSRIRPKSEEWGAVLGELARVGVISEFWKTKEGGKIELLDISKLRRG